MNEVTFRTSRLYYRTAEFVTSAISPMPLVAPLASGAASNKYPPHLLKCLPRAAGRHASRPVKFGQYAFDPLGGNGTAEQIALHLHATIGDHRLELLFRFRAFGGRRHSERLPETRNCFYDLARVSLIDVSDEGLIDFQLVEGKAPEIAERGIARRGNGLPARSEGTVRTLGVLGRFGLRFEFASCRVL
jgi:hypothetical protein